MAARQHAGEPQRGGCRAPAPCASARPGRARASIIRPKGTPLGQAASQARQARHSSIIVVNEASTTASPSSTARIAAMRPRGEAVSRPVSRKVGQCGRHSPHATHLTTSSSSGRGPRGVPAGVHAHSSMPRVEDAGRVERRRAAGASGGRPAGGGPQGSARSASGAVAHHRVPAQARARRAHRGDVLGARRPPPGRCRRPSAPRRPGPPSSRARARSPSRGGETPTSTRPSPDGLRRAPAPAARSPPARATSSAGPASSTATPPRASSTAAGRTAAGQHALRRREPLVERRPRRRTSRAPAAAARASAWPGR